MAHLLAPQKSKPTLPVLFNVDGVVGKAPAANSREDVLLVQFAIATMAAIRLPGTSDAFYQAAKAVKVTGTIDSETINAMAISTQAIANRISGPRCAPGFRNQPAAAAMTRGGATTTAIASRAPRENRICQTK